MKKKFSIGLFFLTGVACFAQNNSIDYFGQTPPGDSAVIFAPGIVSLPNRMEARIAFSPDGNECFFTVPNDFNFSNVQMYYTKRIKKVWTPQVQAPFSLPGFSYSQPFFSSDGNKLYFSSNQNGTRGIWVVEHISNGWGNPKFLSSPINPLGAGEYSQTTDGTAYFESNRSGSIGKVDVWRACPQKPGEPLKLENPGAIINSGIYNSDPFISPDGKYLIFSSYRTGCVGGSDLYVTFANGDDGWTKPVNMNEYCPGINTDKIEYGPSLSPDGLYLFFVRLDYKGQQCDLYWVKNPFSRVANPLSITYIANSGFLFRSGKKNILIDALFNNSFGKYTPPSAGLISQMVNGVEPFSKIDLYLVTHNHGDHFYAPYVNDFLKHHSETYFVSSNEVCDQFKNEDKLKSQVKPVSLDVGECADSVINGLPLKIIRLKHSGDETGTKIANYAYLINLNGIKIFHPGAITVEWDKSLLEKFNLGNEKIDIMFVAYFDLSDVTVKYINDVIKPKYIVAMHIPSNDFEVESKKFLKAFPKGIVLQNPMDKKVFAN